MKINRKIWLAALGCTAIVLSTACSSLKTPATADVAVSKSEVENAAGAGATELAPVEMKSARDKLTLANKALADKDYKLASELAIQAQADAKLARGKANSAKAQLAADVLQEDIQVLRVELDRANTSK